LNAARSLDLIVEKTPPPKIPANRQNRAPILGFPAENIGRLTMIAHNAPLRHQPYRFNSCLRAVSRVIISRTGTAVRNTEKNANGRAMIGVRIIIIPDVCARSLENLAATNVNPTV
jgi:hypothetical protein